MSHRYHPACPGFHPSQVLVDGCPECEKRANLQGVVSGLDDIFFGVMISRAMVLDEDGGKGLHLSELEFLLYRDLGPLLRRWERASFPTLPANGLVELRRAKGEGEAVVSS